MNELLDEDLNGDLNTIATTAPPGPRVRSDILLCNFPFVCSSKQFGYVFTHM